MTPILTILIFAVILVGPPAPPALAGLVSPAVVALLTLLPPAALMLAQGVVGWACRMDLERRGDARAVLAADGTIAGVRWAAVIWHALAVLVLGWSRVVRGALGDWVLIDEFAAALPPLAVIVAGWWTIEPIDRLLREAALLGALDRGRPIHAPPSRAGFVLERVRHGLLIVLIPVVVLAAWSESAARLLDGVAGALAAPLTDGARQAALTALQFIGVVAVVLFLPPIIRRVWATASLPAGDLRERMLGLCRRHGVRVRDVLLWRTRGAMLNGAVLGLLPRLRYVLLTDALLERLPAEQVEAVMAHEVAHVRHRHVPWLAASLLVSVGVPMAGLDVAARAFPAATEGPWWAAAHLALAGAALGAGLGLFGWISRRFEWQADAFAARHFASGALVTPAAAEPMSGALAAVARLNHIPPGRFSWRHGSIARRRRNLAALVGRPAAALPIDRLAARIKMAVAASAAALAAVVWWSW